MNCLDESNPLTHPPQTGIEHLIVIGAADPTQPPREGWTPYGALMTPTIPDHPEARLWVYGRPTHKPMPLRPVAKTPWSILDLYATFSPCQIEAPSPGPRGNAWIPYNEHDLPGEVTISCGDRIIYRGPTNNIKVPPWLP